MNKNEYIMSFSDEILALLSDRELLKLFLSFGTTEEKAENLTNRLFEKFLALNTIFDLSEKYLKEFGLSESLILMIKMIPQITKRCAVPSKNDKYIVDSSSAGNYLLPYFYGETREVLYLVCLSDRGKVLTCRKVFTGDITSASISMRDIVSLALEDKAACAVISHNHPSGFAIPSKEDISTTKKIKNALASVGIQLIDHIIVADSDFISFHDSGYIID